jgi:mRNA interferase MazF
MEGKIVVTIFPQDKQGKLRPALVLRKFPKYNDLLVCGITSRVHQFIPDFDVLLDEAHPDFAMCGLKFPGICRLNMLTMLAVEDVKGSIGEISNITLDALLKTLSDYLVSNSARATPSHK